MDNLPDVIYFKDRESRFTRINLAHANAFGLSNPDEAIGKSDFDFFTAEHAQEAFRDEQEIIRTGQPMVGKEEKETWPDGRVTWVSTTKMPLRDPHGDIIGTFGVSCDITQRKRAEDQLRKLSRAVEQSPASVVITDANGEIEYVNPKFTQITGYTTEEVLGKNPRVLKSGEHSKEMYEELWRTILSGGEWRGEFHNKKKNGELYWESAVISPVRNTEGVITHFLAVKEDITERKQAAEALREREELFRTAFQNAPFGMILSAVDTSISQANDRFCQLLGYSEQEVLARGWLSLTHPDDKDISRRALEEMCRGRVPTSDFEKRYIHKDGSVVWARVRVSLVLDAKGKPAYFITQIEDITERRRREEALRESDEELAAAQRIAHIGSWRWNIPTDTAQWSDETFRIFGLTPGQLKHHRRTFLELTHPADRMRVDCALIDALNGTREYDIEYRIQLANGTEKVIHAQAEVLKNEAGKPIGMRGTNHDITERKRSEEELLLKTALLEAQSETTIDGILVVDMTDQVLLVNRQFARMWGVPEEIIRTKNDTRLLEHVRGQIKAPEAFLEKVHYLYTHKTEKSRDEIELKDGRVFDRYSSPLQASTGKHYGRIWYFRDITERREVERMKGELISVVSHELRTPLTSIRGALGLLSAGLLSSQPDKGKRMLEIAVANTDRLVRLINDILDLERMESGKMSMEKRTSNAANLMTQAEESVRDLAEKAGVTLSVSLHSARLWVDPDRVIQAVVNLLSNAIKFSARGGTIWLSASPQAGQILFQVKDQGRGIPQEKLDSIFERFQQVDASDRREKGGTGLGLPITRSIVQQHGGRIWVESTLGQGSTFSFSLPAVPAETILAAGGLVPRKVLMCAVEADICGAVPAALEQGGYTVTVSSSWHEAIEMAALDRPEAILLDSSLPGMECLEPIDAFKQNSHTQDIPLVGLGGPAPGEVQLAAMGMVGWVAKPWTESSLIQGLESVLGKASERPRVLVVEDDDDLARVLTTVFERHGAVVFHARTGQEAVEVCPQLIPDLLVLDVLLPELDGFGVVERLRQHEQLQHLPVAVYSVKELNDSEKARLRLGESIFMTKSRLTPQEFEERAIGLLKWATSGQKERRRR